MKPERLLRFIIVLSQSQKTLNCNTWEQFFTLSRLFSCIFRKINLNKLSLNLSGGGILCRQKQQS